jgi:hypothetical protein
MPDAFNENDIGIASDISLGRRDPIPHDTKTYEPSVGGEA